MKPYKLTLVRETVNNWPEGRAEKPDTTASYLRDFVFNTKENWREEAYLLTVDQALNITGVFHLAAGSTNQTCIDEKIVANVAVQSAAHGIVLAHNHPTGDPRPSINDIRRTEEVKRTLAVFGTHLIDHIILGEKKFFSFSEDRELRYEKYAK